MNVEVALFIISRFDVTANIREPAKGDNAEVVQGRNCTAGRKVNSLATVIT